MRIGKLNELLAPLTLRLTLADRTAEVVAVESGNPLYGETLRTAWGDVWNMGLDLHVTLPRDAFLDRAVVRFGEESKLTSVTLLGEGTLARYAAESGKLISEQEITLEAAASCRELIFRIEGDLADIVIEEITLYGAVAEGKELFPTPDVQKWEDKAFSAENFKAYRSETALSEKAERVLTEKYEEETGIRLEKAAEGEIVFIAEQSIPVNGFELKVTEQGATLKASDERGFIMAVETLIKLIDDGKISACEIKDDPRHPFRGVHLYIPGVQYMDFAKRMVKYLFSPMGYNCIIMEVAGGMKFDSHPLINEKMEEAVEKGKRGEWPTFPHGSVAEGKAVDKAVLKDLVQYIRSYGIEVIPEIQSLGHVQFMTQAYPEIAEIPEKEDGEVKDTRAEDARPATFYKHCYCPSNPRSYEILFDLIDEIVEVFEPREYVHMGHDEVYEMGVCKVCKQKNTAELFAYDINKIYDYLKTKGLKMMIWADMLQLGSKRNYKTPPAIDMIPKDIVLLDFVWYFHLKDDIEDHLLNHGFKVCMGNLYSSHFPRYCTRSRKEGMVGGQISAWVRVNPESQAQEGKFFDYCMTAQMLMSDDYRPEYFHVYDQMISKQMIPLREKLEGISFPSRQKGAETETLLEQPFTAAPLKEVAVNDTAKSVLLQHTLLRNLPKQPWLPGDKVGEYILTYADGTEERLTLQMGKNIAHWNRRQHQPQPQQMYRHTGYMTVYYCEGIHSKTENGENVCLYQVEVLTDPTKVLRSVKLAEEPAVEAAVAFCKAEIVK